MATYYGNYQDKVEHICNELKSRFNIDSQKMSSAQKQSERNFAMKSLKQFSTRVLVSTDLVN